MFYTNRKLPTHEKTAASHHRPHGNMLRERTGLLYRRPQSRHHAPHRAHRPAAYGIRAARGERLHRLQSRPAHPHDLFGRRLHARVPRARGVVRRPGRAGDHRPRRIPPPRRQDAALPERLRSRRHRGLQQQRHPESGRRTGHPDRPEPPGKAGAGDSREIRHNHHPGR